MNAKYYEFVDGKIAQVGQFDPSKCPQFILNGKHYREDGSCLCSNAEHRGSMIADQGYAPEDFASIPLRD